MEEMWIDIPDFIGIYQLSSLGRFRSKDRIDAGGRKLKGKLLSFGKSGDYLTVALYKDGQRKTYLAHRLVWSAFNGPIPERMTVNHINEDKTDNRLENLNLMTQAANNAWGTRTKRTRKQVYQYDLDWNLVKVWDAEIDIEKELGISTGNICNCCQKKKYYERQYSHGYYWTYEKREP